MSISSCTHFALIDFYLCICEYVKSHLFLLLSFYLGTFFSADKFAINIKRILLISKQMFSFFLLYLNCKKTHNKFDNMVPFFCYLSMNKYVWFLWNAEDHSGDNCLMQLLKCSSLYFITFFILFNCNICKCWLLSKIFFQRTIFVFGKTMFIRWTLKLKRGIISCNVHHKRSSTQLGWWDHKMQQQTRTKIQCCSIIWLKLQERYIELPSLKQWT